MRTGWTKDNINKTDVHRSTDAEIGINDGGTRNNYGMG